MNTAETATVVDSASAERQARPVEVGVGAFVLTGVASGTIAGVSPFVTDGLGRSTFVRLAIGVAQSQEDTPRVTWAAGRVDLCAGIPGNYADGSGLRLDLCGGADVGFTHWSSTAFDGSLIAAQTSPYIALGPSADLRAELGAHMGLSLRGSLGLNVARTSVVDEAGTLLLNSAPGSARLEIAFSWRL